MPSKPFIKSHHALNDKGIAFTSVIWKTSDTFSYDKTLDIGLGSDCDTVRDIWMVVIHIYKSKIKKTKNQKIKIKNQCHT